MKGTAVADKRLTPECNLPRECGGVGIMWKKTPHDYTRGVPSLKIRKPSMKYANKCRANLERQAMHGQIEKSSPKIRSEAFQNSHRSALLGRQASNKWKYYI